MTALDETPQKKSAPKKRAASRSARKRSQVKHTGRTMAKILPPLGPLPGEREFDDALNTDKRRKHNWPAIRTEYIEGIVEPNGEIAWPSLEALAKKYGINQAIVRAQSANEQWVKRKEVHVAAQIAEQRRKRHAELGGMAADIDEKGIKLSQLGLGLVQGRLAEIAKDATMRQAWQRDRDRIIANGGIPDASDSGPAGIDARELDTLGRAAIQWHTLGRNALGDDVTRVEVSGPDGGPITRVDAHLLTDDPDRLVDVIAAMQRSGIIDDALMSGQVVDGEVVDVTEEAEEAAESPSAALSDLLPGQGGGEAGRNDLGLPEEADLDPDVVEQAENDAADETAYDIED